MVTPADRRSFRAYTPQGLTAGQRTMFADPGSFILVNVGSFNRKNEGFYVVVRLDTRGFPRLTSRVVQGTLRKRLVGPSAIAR